jgi:type II secretory pathway pseudopilin PulG
MTNSGHPGFFDTRRIRIPSSFRCRGVCAKRLTNNSGARRGERRYTFAFTIIELLVVIAVIIVLAGLILSTAGYVQKKGARSRAETEIAAMSAACESYKADNGVYPSDGNTVLPDARQNVNPSTATYQDASLALYKFLSGDTNGDRRIDSGDSGKTYIAFKANELSPTDQSQTVKFIRDPFGNSYGYSTIANPTANPNASSSKGYNPTFDLWSTAGGTTPNDVSGWITNW